MTQHVTSAAAMRRLPPCSPPRRLASRAALFCFDFASTLRGEGFNGSGLAFNGSGSGFNGSGSGFNGSGS
eukprot:403613-Rhodomonas_salina.1